MKKIVLLAFFALFGFSQIQAQKFKIGVNAAIPVGDFGDITSFGLNADFMYLFEVLEGIQVGPIAGVQHYFGKDFEESFGGINIEVEAQDFTFLPVGLTGRVMLGESLLFGADLGYAIGISPDGNDGGFAYRPRLGYKFSDNISGMFTYQGISTEGDPLNTLTLGVEIGL